MIDVKRLQFQLGDVLFGHGTDATIESIDGIGTGRLNSREYQAGAGDGTVFGRERRDGGEWQFSGQIVREDDEAGAWNRSAELHAVFDGAEVRSRSRAVVPLHYRRPGADTRVVYGRPDEYEPDVALGVVGLIPFSATFRLAHPSSFDALEQQLVLGLTTASSGGIVTDEDGNLRSPIVTVGSTRRASIVHNAGTAPAWPVIRIQGPVARPSVRLVDANGGRLWRIGLTSELAYDQVAVIDTRPWSRGAALESGSPLSGALTPDSVPSRSFIPPGSWDVVAEGADVTGTARFDVRWRNAHRGI